MTSRCSGGTLSGVSMGLRFIATFLTVTTTNARLDGACYGCDYNWVCFLLRRSLAPSLAPLSIRSLPSLSEPSNAICSVACVTNHYAEFTVNARERMPKWRDVTATECPGATNTSAVPRQSLMSCDDLYVPVMKQAGQGKMTFSSSEQYSYF